METATMEKLETISDLKKLLESKDNIKLYGAGYYLSLFLENIEKMDPVYLKKIGFIMVADTKGNPVSAPTRESTWRPSWRMRGFH